MTFRPNQHPDELISASLTGDLSAAERSTVDRHLAACERCRITLAAFAEERRLIGSMRELAPPRDLPARVQAGIEGGRHAPAPWWRRPSTVVGGFASLATVAAALLAVVILSDLRPGPTGASGEPTTSVSASSQDADPSATPLPSAEATPDPTVEPPPPVLAEGQIGYLQLDGEPESPLALSFANDATGAMSDLGTASGPPVAAAISPTNEFVAYIVELGLSGANQVRITRLSDGATEVLGCTAARAFTDRLAWSDDGRFLGYTLTPIDLGESVDCGGVSGDGTRTDAWVYDAGASATSIQLTQDGNSFTADALVYSLPSRDGTNEPGYALLVSHAGSTPWTELVGIGSSFDQDPIEGVFLPLLSPDGSRALFWRGQMGQVADGGWHFVQGGLPYLSGEPVDGQPSWSGQPLFADLEPLGGSAFEAGQFGWSPDGQLVGFWLGEWTGAPQSADGSYPSSRSVYAGPVDDLLSSTSRVPLELGEQQGVVHVTLDGDSRTALVTAVQPSAGDLAVPASTLYAASLEGGEPALLGRGASWTGPAVIGLEAVALTP